MNNSTKKLHVRFVDDLPSKSNSNKLSSDESTAKNKEDVANNVLSYSREDLLDIAQNKASKTTPVLFEDFDDANEKRREKIRHVMKNGNNSKWAEKYVRVAPTSDNGVAKKDVAHNVNDQQRSDFQQLIASAVKYTQQSVDLSTGYENRRRRIGSGRITVDCTAKDNNNFTDSNEVDTRYTQNELFKDVHDAKMAKNWKFSMDSKWTFSNTANHPPGDLDDTKSTKSDEPEWANARVSKSDIIELHGFDGPIEDEKQKNTSTETNALNSPPADRSTPSKSCAKGYETKKTEFNFDDFMKIDVPNGASEPPTGSRFSQWFARDSMANQGKVLNGPTDGKSTSMLNKPQIGQTQQFFNYHQKSNLKKMSTVPNLASAAKVRSVDELEADWYQQKQPNIQPTSAASLRAILNQLAMSHAAVNASTAQEAQTMNATQSNYLMNLVNNKAGALHQQRMAQNTAMKRPAAQLLLHRLVNSEISQYWIYQQVNNPHTTPYDRETYLAVLTFCDENKQWLMEQQQQQIKHKEIMSAQLRKLQMQVNAGQLRSYTPQELQMHTKIIMQNAILKKKMEEQCLQQFNLKPMHDMKFKNQQFFSRSGSFHNKRQTQTHQDGLQFIQAHSNKPMWNNHGQYHAANLPFRSEAPTPTPTYDFSNFLMTSFPRNSAMPGMAKVANEYPTGIVEK